MIFLLPAHLNGVYPEPTLQLDHQQTQELMDSLWDCGIRPTEGTGSAGAMAAMQKHLEDMRTLVFKKLASANTNTSKNVALARQI